MSYPSHRTDARIAARRLLGIVVATTSLSIAWPSLGVVTLAALVPPGGSPANQPSLLLLQVAVASQALAGLAFAGMLMTGRSNARMGHATWALSLALQLAVFADAGFEASPFGALGLFVVLTGLVLASGWATHRLVPSRE